MARKDPVAVDADGKPMDIIPSVFDRTVELRSNASIDDYLTINVKAVYQLDVTDGREQLMDRLDGDSMLAFDFNYRAGVETDTAFIVPDDGQTVEKTIRHQSLVSSARRGIIARIPIALPIALTKHHGKYEKSFGAGG